ncbi:hypothetical protein QZH41_002842 [Actinostola sp. cb2023]|nr:hypothetical protein QZH41_002842 [Actinostola sp. cb2023]
MGCDGGTIPTRDELVRLKKKPEKIDKNFELNAKWFHCAITQESLRAPIVSCELGKLYNKESLLEYLLDKEAATTEVANHIRSLKDTKELVLTENAAFEEKSKVESAEGYQDFQASPYVCPVVGIEMNGRYKFCFLWKCGCVLSERALKEVKSPVCHKCGKPFSHEDIVILNGCEEDMEVMKVNMLQRRQKAKLEKKSKKSKTSSTVTSSNGISSSTSVSASNPEQAFKRPSEVEVEITSKKLKVDSRPQLNGAAGTSSKGPQLNGAAGTSSKGPQLNGATGTSSKGPQLNGAAGTSSKGPQLSGATGTSSKGPQLNGAAGASSKGQKKSKGKQPKINMSLPKLSKYKTVAEDPSASKVYKSLFASSSKERPDHLKSNWVTYHAYGGYHI